MYICNLAHCFHGIINYSYLVGAVINPGLYAYATGGISISSTISENREDNTTSTSHGLSFDTQNMTHRPATEECAPHQAQTTTTQEWWYVTALLHDAADNRYLLFNTVFKYDGKDIPNVSSVPAFASKLGPNSTIMVKKSFVLNKLLRNKTHLRMKTIESSIPVS
ncbi:MAG: hypothetical protein M3Q77_06375 [Thermoproteota archaeon]|nr:hypothetical protein [Thermoproteota archaeon]